VPESAGTPPPNFKKSRPQYQTPKELEKENLGKGSPQKKLKKTISKKMTGVLEPRGNAARRKKRLGEKYGQEGVENQKKSIRPEEKPRSFRQVSMMKGPARVQAKENQDKKRSNWARKIGRTRVELARSRCRGT